MSVFWQFCKQIKVELEKYDDVLYTIAGVSFWPAEKSIFVGIFSTFNCDDKPKSTFLIKLMCGKYLGGEFHAPLYKDPVFMSKKVFFAKNQNAKKCNP